MWLETEGETQVSREAYVNAGTCRYRSFNLYISEEYIFFWKNMASLSPHCQACEDRREKMECPTYIRIPSPTYNSRQERTMACVINAQTKQHIVVFKEQFTRVRYTLCVEFIIRKTHACALTTHGPPPFSRCIPQNIDFSVAAII